MKAFIPWISLLFSIVLLGQESKKEFSLYYENDAYELTEKHKKLTDSLQLLPNKSRYYIYIKGYTNNVGGEYYNLELSKKRAESVKKELSAFAFISTKGYGELNSEAANNRRVDIVVILREDYVPKPGDVIEYPEDHTPETVTELVSPKVGDKVIIEGIMFYPDQDVIMNESRKALDNLVRFLKENPKIRFKLLGHICCGNSYQPEMDLRNTRTGENNLSEARAKSVYNYLRKKGISKHRMRYVGMAYLEPTGKGDEFDRRVEIEITAID